MRNIRIAGLVLATTLMVGCASGPFGMGGSDAALGGAGLSFVSWDTDGDGTLGNEEFEGGVQREGWFEDLDVDADNRLSASEFTTASAGWGLGADAFSNWDTTDDNFLNEDEFIDGLFETWDRDDDFVLGDDEFGTGIAWFD